MQISRLLERLLYVERSSTHLRKNCDRKHNYVGQVVSFVCKIINNGHCMRIHYAQLTHHVIDCPEELMTWRLGLKHGLAKHR